MLRVAVKQKLHHQLPSTPLESQGKHAVKMEEEMILPGSQHPSKHAPNISTGLSIIQLGAEMEEEEDCYRAEMFGNVLEEYHFLPRRLAGYRP